MKHRSKAVPGILLVALGALFLGSACVRLNEPSVYKCETDSDCDSSEHCSASKLCQSDSVCDYDGDCEGGKICSARSCIAPQCTQLTGQCGAYQCSLGRCTTSCGGDSSCRPGAKCSAGQCVEPGSVANDKTCSTDAACQSQHCCTNGFSTGVCRASCLKAVGAACATGAECTSNLCCPTKGTTTLTCSATPCSEIPECSVDLDCKNAGKCTAGKCVAVAPQKTGASCTTATQCLSAICQANTCRAVTGDPCTVYTECEMGHVCCANATGTGGTCSGADGKCALTIGARCTKNADCSSGMCNDSVYCTKYCTSGAECGVSPWGDANSCETNGLGQQICFPGCTTSSECQSNLGSRFGCYYALNSSGKVCEVN